MYLRFLLASFVTKGEDKANKQYSGEIQSKPNNDLESEQKNSRITCETSRCSRHGSPDLPGDDRFCSKSCIRTRSTPTQGGDVGAAPWAVCREFRMQYEAYFRRL